MIASPARGFFVPCADMQPVIDRYPSTAQDQDEWFITLLLPTLLSRLYRVSGTSPTGR